MTRSNLIVEHALGRYTFHDLLRAYATEQANAIDDDRRRHAAVHRMLDHYLHTAYTAERLLFPARGDPITVTPPQPGTTPQHLGNRGQAMDWLATEHAVLLAVVDYAAATGFDTHAWQLAWSLTTFLARSGLRNQSATILRTAVTAAHRLADAKAEARARTNLAHSYVQLGRLNDAHSQLQHALELIIASNDLTGQGFIHNMLAYACSRQEDHVKALNHAQRSVGIFEATDHRFGLASALILAGPAYAHLGDHQQALTTGERALALFQELDDLDGKAEAWDCIGYAYHHLGHYAQAIISYQQALMLYRDLGDLYEQAETLAHLGDTYQANGDSNAARTAYQQALVILDQLQHIDANLIRTKLTSLITDKSGQLGP